MNGILPLYKPKGLTSHDCVLKLRKLLKIKKIGHTGTLDPDVDGVLPICIGRATKVVQYITNADKTYEGEVTLGYTTTTEDASGDKVEEMLPNLPITREQIIKTLDKFHGEIIQVPPMFSAVKVKGKKLYEYAREGKEVERPSRTIRIKNLELLDQQEMFLPNPTITFRFRVKCSKGTYVRTLAVDIGKDLGFPAHMSQLTRVEAASIKLENTITFSEIEEAIHTNTLDNLLISIEKSMSDLTKWTIDDKLEEKIRNGAVLPKPDELKDDFWMVLNKDGVCLALYKPHPTKLGLMKPEKIILPLGQD